MEGRSRGGRQVADNEWHFVLIRPVFGVAQNSDGSEGRGGERGRKFVMERGPSLFQRPPSRSRAWDMSVSTGQLDVVENFGEN